MEPRITTTARAIATLAQPTPEKPAVIAPRQAQSFLEAFQTKGDPTRERMLAEAKGFCCELQGRSPARWLSILGPSGIGKTMLARAVSGYVKEFGSWYRINGSGGPVRQQHRCMWVSWRRACRDMRGGDFSTVEELCIPQSEKDHAVWFAVIDDIGSAAESDRGYLKNSLESIVDARIGAWTVFTSNLLLDQISEQMDRRIASRMIRDGNIVVEAPELPDWNLQ